MNAPRLTSGLLDRPLIRILTIFVISLLICFLYVGTENLVSAFNDSSKVADEGLVSLEGQVVGETDVPLSGLRVVLYQKRGWWRWAGETTTNAQGDYAFVDLAPGVYRVYVWDPFLEHLPRFYKDEPDFASATEITITPGQEPDPLNDIVLARVQGTAQMGILAHMSDITGYVRTADGTSIPDVHVTAYRLNDGGGWSSVRVAVTDDSGAYGFYGLETGIYKIYFNESSRTYLDEYYNNAERLDDAIEIAVQGENISGLNVVLDKPGTIVGTLSATDGSGPSYSEVQAYYEEDGVWQRAAWAYPGPESDMYRISGLRPGTYRVGAETPTDPNGGTTGNVDYAPEYYDNAIYIEDGADVQVTGTMTTTGIDFTLTPGGTITGFVTNTDGAPIPNVAVKAYRQDGEAWRLAAIDYTAYVAYPGPDTDVQPYTLSGLWDGTFRVKFEAPAGYLNEYYDNATDITAADDIAVSLGETVPNVNAVLAADGAVISGQTTSDTGEPLSGIRVSAYRWDEHGDYWPHSSYRNTLTNDDGNYHLRGLATGVYRVAFDDPTGMHQDVYYDGVVNENAATPITITSPVSQVVGVNGALTGCAYISGTVTGGGTPLSGIRVRAYREGSDGHSYRSATTDSDGAYLLTDLVSDTYRIGFEDPYGTYGFEYYDDQQTVGAADGIVLTTGVPVTGVNAVLSPGGHITGTLNTVDGQDVGRVAITAYLNNGSAWEEATSYSGYPGPNSTYDLGGLASGTYRMKFEEDHYRPQYYNGQETITDATDISVNVGATTTNINVFFEPYASVISGTVTNEGGNPLTGMEVKAYVYDSWWSYYSQTTTDAEGRYGLTSLKPGEYRVSFNDPSGVYFSEYYADAEDSSGATTIVITDTAPITTGIDAQLAAKSAITGVVTFPEGTPNRLYVRAYADDGGDWTEQSSTSFAYPGPSVTFTLDDLRADTYKVGFEARDFKPVFYDGAETLTDATEIVLNVGATVLDINAVIDSEYGTITGVVTTDSPWPSNITVSAYQDEGSGWESFKEITLRENPEAGPALAYELTGLPTGTYRVCFSASDHEEQCYNGASQVDNAADIAVTDGETTSDIDASLVSEVAYSAVSGQVKATDDSQPIQDIRVDFYRQDLWGDWYRYAFDDTDSGGNYSVDGLREGAYRLHFYDPDSHYAETYYWGSTALTTADTITLSNGLDTDLMAVSLTGYGNVPAAVNLEADPSTIAADGTATAHLTATVTNGAGNPVPDGTQVRFETDLGSVGSQVITTTTEGGEGQATATLTAGTTAGVANVSATSGDVSASTTVTLTPNVPDTLVLEATSDTLPADGTSSTTLTARVTDTYGNLVADGTDVEFTTTLGNVGGQSAVTKQTLDGEVTVELTAGTTAGTTTVTASSGAATDNVTVDFTATSAASVLLTVNPTAILADGESQARLTVTVSDAYDNPVAEGTPVTLTTTLGDFGGQSTVTKQTVNGEVTADLTSSTDIGQATVTAVSGDGSDSITIDFFQGEETAVDPDEGGELNYTDPEDNTELTVQVPGGAITDDATLRYTSGSTSPPDPDLSLAGTPFQLDLYKDGEKVEGIFFDKAITVTITYDSAALEGVDTASLTLYRWHDDEWKAVEPGNFWPSEDGKDESCTFADGTRTLTCYLWKLSDFISMGKTEYKVYLPLTIRK